MTEETTSQLRAQMIEDLRIRAIDAKDRKVML